MEKRARRARQVGDVRGRLLAPGFFDVLLCRRQRKPFEYRACAGQRRFSGRATSTAADHIFKLADVALNHRCGELASGESDTGATGNRKSNALRPQP